MNKLLTLAALAALTTASSAAVAYVDFGAVASTGNGFNNFTLTGGEQATGPRGSLSGIQTTDGVTSSWNLSVSKASTGGVGSTGAVWTGSPANAGSPFTGLQSALLGDSIYINNNAVVTFTFSGLDITQTYNFDVLGALDGTGSSPSNFSLTVGTSASTATQVLDIDNTDGNADGAVASWAEITPDASGNISITVSANGGASGFRTGVNAIRIESVDAIPEPSSTALLGLGGLALILRRRK